MPSKDEDDLRGSEVSVVRTESHLARFNTARALFEKLGEENKGFHRIEKSPSAAASFAGTRGSQPTAPARSRSSSAGSVSPPRCIPVPSVPTINGDRLANGSGQPPAKLTKPSVLPKPEKPDRRFNKELIEKQKNWTAHFAKPRVPRHEVDVRTESKYPSGYNERKSPEVADRTVIPSRVYSPPLSPCAGDSHVVERPTTLPTNLATRALPNLKSPSPVKTIPISPSSRSNNVVSPTFKSDISTSSAGQEKIDSPNIYNSEKLQREIKVSHDAAQSDSEEVVYCSPSREHSSPTKGTGVLVSSIPFTKTSETVSPSSIHCSLGLERNYPVKPVSTSSVSLPSPSKRSPKSPLPPLPHKDIVQNSDSSDHISPLPVEECVTHSPVINKPKSLEDDDYEPIEYTGTWEEIKNETEKRRSSTPESASALPTESEDVARSPLTSPLASPVQRSVSSPPPVQSSPSPGENALCIKVI